ncbi:MAG: hypothetical protein IJ580_04955 [Prevotella sp.]|nr:hypothetical protein [Prevotella sp.]
MAQSLDKHHLLLDSQLEESSKSPYAFRTIQEAAAHFSDNTTLYIKPGVYWVDDPDKPEVVVGKDGREPFGMVIKCKNLHLIGLDKDARNTVLASQRGQTQGAIGNFTMFDFWCDNLQVENLTMGNYCNVDLDYPLNPALSRKKRSDAITQAHVGYVHGKSLKAKNVRFVSRLNLNPLNGAEQSYYEDCHFECTDDAMNGTAVYRHCEVDLYGQKPFWSTFGRGAMFIDCDFNVMSDNREMYFCKQGGPLTLIDCRYHAPSDSIYIGWTAYPQPWLRCYQQNFTFNGKPYFIGSRQPENTISLKRFKAKEVPYLPVSQHEATLVTGVDTLLLSAPKGCSWRVERGYERYVQLSALDGDTICVIPSNDTDEIANFCVEAYSDNGFVAACALQVKPSVLPPPALLSKPKITGSTLLKLDYQLDLDGHRDESRVTWYRDDIPVSVSHVEPQLAYLLTAADMGHVVSAVLEPKSNRSGYGKPVKTQYVSKLDFSPILSLVTDFHDFPCEWQKELLPGYWTVDGFKPSDTAEFPWSFDDSKPMWKYGEGYNGAVGYGLLQEQRGARLMYLPLADEYGDMELVLKVDPTKTAGQGFGSATGQYMDICLKFDPITLTGYGLRIIRTTKHAKAVDFYLVSYHNGEVKAISDPISSTCYRTGCTIILKSVGSRLSAHVETTTPRPSASVLPHEVDLNAEVTPNPFGGIAIQHTGSSGGESTTMLHHLSVTWK